jgi:hypothetical protein
MPRKSDGSAAATGPFWVAEAGAPGERVLQIVGRSFGQPRVVGVVHGTYGYDVDNARLIAASWSLRKAVIATLRALENYTGDDPAVLDALSACVSAMNEAEGAALAQADDSTTDEELHRWGL